MPPSAWSWPQKRSSITVSGDGVVTSAAGSGPAQSKGHNRAIVRVVMTELYLAIGAPSLAKQAIATTYFFSLSRRS
ncbi:hypothetical protein GCM10022265_20060 [Marinobacter xestospongiae]